MKSISVALFLLLTDHPFLKATSTRTAESTSFTKNGSDFMQCSASRKMIDMQRKLKVTNKSDKATRRCKVVPFTRKIKIKIPRSLLRLRRSVRLPEPRLLMRFRTSNLMTMAHLRFLPNPLRTRLELLVQVSFISVYGMKRFFSSFFYCNSGVCPYVTICYSRRLYFISLALCHHRAVKCCGLLLADYIVSRLGPYPYQKTLNFLPDLWPWLLRFNRQSTPVSGLVLG